MKTGAISLCRILMGAIFLVFGLNGFFNFFPTPAPAGEAARGFLSGLQGSGYFFPFEKTVEVVAGLLLITNTWTPFALVLLGPVVVNILLYHGFLDPGGLPLALLLTALEVTLVVAYWDHFRPLFASSTAIPERREALSEQGARDVA